MVTRLHGGGLENQGLIPFGTEIFLFSTASIPALGPTQPPIQWVLGILPGKKLITYI
jgi:hypothetical protein